MGAAFPRRPDQWRSIEELKAMITHITIYCGVPVGVECHRIANRVLAEQGLQA